MIIKTLIKTEAWNKLRKQFIANSPNFLKVAYQIEEKNRIELTKLLTPEIKMEQPELRGQLTETSEPLSSKESFSCASGLSIQIINKIIEKGTGEST